MAIGSVIFLGLWWVIRKKVSAKEDRRAYFILLGILFFVPLPVPVGGWTTLAGYIVVFAAYFLGFDGIMFT